MIDFHKENIKELTLQDLQLKFVVEILKKCKNLTKLNCEELYGIFDGNEIEIPGLKELKIHYESDLIIKAENLENLFLNSVLKVEEILKFYPKLKNLKIENLRRNFKFFEVPQKLTKLEIKLGKYDYDSEDLNLIQLLRSQKENLSELILITKNREHEIEFAINEMKVEKLKIEIAENFEKKLKVNESIKNLTLFYEDEPSEVEESIFKILQVCPKVETLTFDFHHGEIDEILEFIPQTHPKLKNLNILVTFYSLKIHKKINLSSIENLSIFSRDNAGAEYLQNLLLSFENLKKCKIKFRCDTTQYLMTEKEIEKLSCKIFKNLKKLEVFESNFGFQLSPKVVKILSENSTLKRLKLVVKPSNYVEQLRLSKMIQSQCIVIKFCDFWSLKY